MKVTSSRARATRTASPSKALSSSKGGSGRSQAPGVAVQGLPGDFELLHGPVDVDHVLGLQRTAGNHAVDALLHPALSVQRGPGDGGLAPAPAFDTSHLFGESDLLAGKPPIGDKPAEAMDYDAVQQEIHKLERWTSKQTQSTTQDNVVSARVSALEHRLTVLGTPVKGKKKKGATTVPKPRSLDPSFDFDKLSHQEAAAELNAIVEYLRTSPPKAEQRRLISARMILEERGQAAMERQDESVRQRDLVAALTPMTGNPEMQLRQVLATIEGIYADPDVPGQWVLTAGSMAIPVADVEVKSLRAEVRKQLSAAIVEAAALNRDAYEGFEDRRKRNKEHPIVHGLVKFSTGIDDLDELEIFGREETGRALEHQALAFLRKGQFAAAYQQTTGLAASAEGLARTVGEWESTLLKGAGRWVLALTILKEGLTLLATAGAAGLTTKLAKGVGYLRAGATVGGATTAAGAIGGGGGAAAADLLTGNGPSVGSVVKGARVGGGAGFTIGAAPAVIGGAKKLVGVGEGVLTVGNLGKAAAVETIGSGAVNVTGAAISGTSTVDALKGTAGAPIGALGGQVVSHVAHGSKAITAGGGAIVGAASNTTSALAQGKSGSEVGTAAAFGGIGGGLNPYLSDPKHYDAGGGTPPAPDPTPASKPKDVHAGFDVSDVNTGTSGGRGGDAGHGFDVSDVSSPTGSSARTGTTGAGSGTSGTGTGTGEPTGTVRTAATGDETGSTGGSGSTPGSTSGSGAQDRTAPMAVGRGVEYVPQPKGKFRAIGKPSAGITQDSVIVQDRASGKKFLFKPLGAERPVADATARGVTEGHYAARAKASQLGAEALGVATPAVELVVINGRKGSLTEWVDGAQSFGKWVMANQAEFSSLKRTPEFVAAMAEINALDYLINNVDRVQNLDNYLIEFTPDGKFKSLTPIDSELSFTSTEKRAIIPLKAGGLPDRYSPKVASRLAQLHADPSQFTSQILPLVGERAIPGVLSRLNELYTDAVSKGAIKPGAP